MHSLVRYGGVSGWICVGCRKVVKSDDAAFKLARTPCVSVIAAADDPKEGCPTVAVANEPFVFKQRLQLLINNSKRC